ncbi:2'-5' RNA ligase family protein [Pullulanibacillus sp. KACC 23026]|uniref:2'-5' RNA ligase family protein n=1 Tax=Pullulanibacillus sp. KACC 23026 TaxID=3028315 RepID=UPI0023B073F2|nr:2'-5' RNA ligase family protein [Pullulanibacillus sp. KACC 23026]WEG10900.1 2'-5' RNA ligase family protein [Pullulanibacillus sp. KACC 23026]
MYGMITLFDEKTEQFIKDIWELLRKFGISSYAFEVEDRRPHLTLASYSDIDGAAFMDKMKRVYENKKALPITFSTIGSFIGSGTLFYSPTHTSDLMDFHCQHHRQFEDFASDADSLYSPDKWIPHCTIANRLSPDKLMEAFHFCSNKRESFSGQLKEVALIDTSQKNKAPILYSVALT